MLLHITSYHFALPLFGLTLLLFQGRECLVILLHITSCYLECGILLHITLYELALPLLYIILLHVKGRGYCSTGCNTLQHTATHLQVSGGREVESENVGSGREYLRQPTGLQYEVK